MNTQADLLLERFCRSSSMGVFGSLELPDGFVCHTCENPWLGNRRNVSCIPSGVYRLVWEASPMMAEKWPEDRLGGGFAWELKDVPGRSECKLHPGNVHPHTEGCILVGDGLSALRHEGKLLWAVTRSQDTLAALLDHLDENREYLLEVRWQWAPQYP